MTRREAFLTALRLETPDVVPVAPLIHYRYAHEVLGRHDWRAVFEVHQRLGSTHFRGPIGVGTHTSGEGEWTATTRVLSERGTRRDVETVYSGPEGSLRAVDVEGMIPHDPLTGKRTEYPVRSRDDWDLFAAMQRDWLDRASEPANETAAEAWHLMGEDGVASVAIPSVYGMLGQARGMQDLLYDLYDIPDTIREVQELLVQRTALAVQAFLESPCEVAWYDICWATGSQMSPEMFEHWVIPDVAMVCELVRQVPGRFVGLYTLGPIRELLPSMVDAGAHFIETFEPNEGDITLREATRLYGNDICVMGNFDCVPLAMGTPDDCRGEALRCLDEAMEGGGYIMVSGDEVPADTRWENLVAWVETVAEHGRY